MHWNTGEIALATQIVAGIDISNAPLMTATSTGRVVVLRLSAAASLKEGLSWTSPGLLLIRHLFRELRFDENRIFRWRFEHKLVQAAVLNHYSPGVVPVTRGLCRALFEHPQNEPRSLLESKCGHELIVKAALGDSSGDLKQVDRAQAAFEEIRGTTSVSCPTDLWEERFILQERLEIAEEYRVHTIEDQVVPELTFGRYRRIRPAERDLPNKFVQNLLGQLPEGLLAGTLYGWDVARTKSGHFFIIEANPAGIHPVFQPGFQCSYFFAEPSWGLPITAKLLHFIREHYKVEIRIEVDLDSPSDERYRYWWVSRWLELFSSCRSVCSVVNRAEKEGFTVDRRNESLPFAEQALLWAVANLLDVSRAVDELCLPSEIPNLNASAQGPKAGS